MGDHGRTPDPLVGRDDELARLRACYDQARAGRARTVVVTGGDGVGRSALCEAFLSGLATRTEPALLLRGGCLPPGATPVAFAPLLGIWRQLVGPGLTGRLAEMASLQGAPPDVVRAVLADRLVDDLTATARHRVLVLLLEDVHHGDPATHAVLRLLADTQRGRRLLVVTSRDDGSAQTLGAAPYADHLPLRPLPPNRVAELVLAASARAGGTLGPADAERVVARSRGHLGTALELARWDDPATVPPSLNVLLRNRIEGLGPVGPAVMATVALAPSLLDEPFLVRLHGPPAAQVIASALSSSMLEPDPAGRLNVPQTLLAEVARALLTAGRRTRLHATVAERLTDQALDQAAPGVGVAGQWEAAGRPDVAAGVWLRTGRRANAERDWALAGTCHRRAFELAEDRPGRLPDSDRAESGLAAAEALRCCGEVDTAARLLGRLLASARPLDEETRCVALNHLHACHYSRGDVSRAFAILDDAVAVAATLPASSPARAWLMATDASREMVLGRLDQATAQAERALVAAESAGAHRVRAHAWCTLGVCLGLRGRLDRGRAALVRSRQLARQAGSLVDQARATSNLTYVLANASRYAECAGVARAGLAELAQHGVEASLGATTAVNLAVALTALGDWDAVDELAASVERRPVPAKARAHLQVVRAEAAALSGRTEAAGAVLAETRVLARSYPILLAEHRYACALLAWCTGRNAAAVQTCQVALRDDDVGPADRLRLAAVGLAAHQDMRAAGRARRPESGSAAAEPVADFLADAERATRDGGVSPEARALRAQCRAEASRADPPPAEAVAAWSAVAARWSALQMPLQVGYAQLRGGEALAAAGQRPAAAEMLGQAHAAAVDLGAEALRVMVQRVARRVRLPLGEPAAASGVGRPSGGDALATLTDRESDVLELVEKGSNNAEVAAALVISQRTVAVHVSRILAKLGAANRAQAASIARSARG
jgi:DNA-binding CsgD family transcriptional regulator/tetratricopeptide (TPR) repeat protein